MSEFNQADIDELHERCEERVINLVRRHESAVSDLERKVRDLEWDLERKESELVEIQRAKAYLESENYSLSRDLEEAKHRAASTHW